MLQSAVRCSQPLTSVCLFLCLSVPVSLSPEITPKSWITCFAYNRTIKTLTRRPTNRHNEISFAITRHLVVCSSITRHHVVHITRCAVACCLCTSVCVKRAIGKVFATVISDLSTGGGRVSRHFRRCIRQPRRTLRLHHRKHCHYNQTCAIVVRRSVGRSFGCSAIFADLSYYVTEF